MTSHLNRWALPVLLVAALSACAADEAGPTPPPTASVSPTATRTPTASTAAVETEILKAYFRYWEATVAAQRGNPDPELFVDNAAGEQVEKELARARDYEEIGLVREGEPAIDESSLEVEIDGERATVGACVDQTEWVIPEASGAPEEAEPLALQLDRIDGAWYVTAYVSPSATVTC